MPPSLAQMFNQQSSIGKAFDNSLMGANNGLGASLDMPTQFKSGGSGSGGLPHFSQDTIKVTIEFEGQDERTMFKNMKVQHDPMGSLLLAPLIEQIKAEGFSMRGHVVSYFSAADKAYVFVGKDPIGADTVI